MTWNELKEKAKELGYVVRDYIVWNGISYSECESLSLNSINFSQTGEIFLDYVGVVAYTRTPEQMWQIMEALK